MEAGKDFLDSMQKALTIKENFDKTLSKETDKEINNRHSTDLEEVFIKHIQSTSI